MSFEDDLKSSEIDERNFIIRFLQWKNENKDTKSRIIGIQFSEDVRFTDYDVKIISVLNGKKKETTFEIKHDKKVQETWNIAFELQYKGNDSWVIATKADYIIYIVEWKFYKCKPKDLLEFLRVTEWQIVNWWDNNDSKLMLVKKEDFTKNFKPI